MHFDGIALVTGAAGFLGQQLAAALAKRGVRLRAAVRAGEDTTLLRKLGAELRTADLRDPETHEKLLKGQMRIVNSPMRMKQRGTAHPDNWLSGQLYRIFAMGYLF